MAPSPVTAPEYQHYIDGQWVASGATYDVLNPYDRSVFARAAAGSGKEAQAAVDAAAAAFPAWAALAPERKQALFLRAAEIAERNAERDAGVLVRETGASRIFAGFQHRAVAAVLRRAAGWVMEQQGEVLAAPDAGTFSVAVRKPLGVVAAFTPWNGANTLAWRAAAQALAAGNTLVLKPSELSPVSAGLVVAQTAGEAGFPPGVVNVVTHAPGAAGPIADVFYDRPEVRCIYFIGSVGTGRMLAERAGRALKRSVMELGGYNPMIVLADADADYAARSAAMSAFLHQGQICFNARAVYVERPAYDEFLARLIVHTRRLPAGDPADPRTIVGPLISDQAAALVQERIRDAVARGARVVAGGGCDGRVHEPTVLVDVPDDAAAAREETFGPLLVVHAVDSAADAVARINRSMYGLSASVLTGQPYRGFELARQINSGIVHVNGPTVEDSIEAPIGGVRDSGWGRHGDHAREDLTDLVWINVRNDKAGLPI
jgi:acyl-CoA reductase-like NAD-dependent aldehyde dehydrogenase